MATLALSSEARASFAPFLWALVICHWALRPLQLRQHFLRMLLRFHRRPDLFDFSIRPDQERHAVRAHVLASHETLLAPDAIRPDNLLVLIRQQRERQLELL